MFDRAARTLATAAKRTSPRYVAMLIASIVAACLWQMPGLTPVHARASERFLSDS